MKILLYSDIHIYNHYGNAIFETIAEDFLSYIYNYCKQNNIKKIFFAGDFFHVKNKLQVIPTIKAFEQIAKLSTIAEQYFIVGNHDRSQKLTNDYSSLEIFKKFGIIIPDYSFFDIDGIRFHFLGYLFPGEKLPNFEYAEKNILITHLDIKNFFMNSFMQSYEGFTIDNFQKFDLVFSGHYHQYQKQQNIIYIGSPYKTNFSEINQQKGFIIFDTKNFKYEFIPYNNAPDFVEYDITNKSIEEINNLDVQNKFIRLLINFDQKDIKQLLYDKGALYISEVIKKDTINILDDLPNKDFTNSDDLIQQYLDYVITNNLLPENLQKLNNPKLEILKVLKKYSKIQ